VTDACIIEVAVNGSTSKDVNPHVPRTPAEVAADALACLGGGATIVHSHTDDPLFVADGVHSAEPYEQAWRAVLAQRPDALLYPTMASGGPGITIEARWSHHLQLAAAGVCQMGLVDPGSVSLGLLEPDGLPMALDLVYLNTFADARYMVDKCRELGLAPSISIFDPSFLRVALAYHDAGALPAGAMIKLYFGGLLPIGLPPTTASLDAYVDMLRDSGLPWLVAVLGGDVLGCGLAHAALERGGHIRVGLEDYLGPRTPRNIELLEEIVAVVDDTGRSVASSEQTRQILGIGGSPARAC
jgi:uncharacterized protein (DUF849 family)